MKKIEKYEHSQAQHAGRRVDVPRKRRRGERWISWQEPTQWHECSTGAADVAQFLAVSRWEATKLILFGDPVNEKNSARSCLESKSR